MPVRFSLVYPTRHRPEFMARALRFLEKQAFRDFEVIVSDNYIDPALSCEEHCRTYSLGNLRYVRPPKPVGMVENWNYAFRFVTGDYVCYLADKMFLLPGTLASASEWIGRLGAEIVNWVESSYYPTQSPQYFGAGTLIGGSAPSAASAAYLPYDPRAELSRRGRAEVSRNEQDRHEFARGKINYGAYSARLCRRIAEDTGALFHSIAPDYTSMILALSAAATAAETRRPGIVHVHTDISNGGQVAVRDDFAYGFLSDLGGTEALLDGLLVPGLYSSAHNIVAHDFLSLKRKYCLGFDFSVVNWLAYITEDLDVPGRVWSSAEVERRQRALLAGFVGGLPVGDQLALQKLLAGRAARRARREKSVTAVKAMLPQALTERIRRIVSRWPGRGDPRACSSIEDVINPEFARLGPGSASRSNTA